MGLSIRCLFLFIICAIWSRLNGKKSNNLMEPDIIVHCENINRIEYSSSELRKIGSNYMLNSKNRRPPDFQTLKTIKFLRINRRRIRFKNKPRSVHRHINHNNLCELPHDPDQPILNNKNIIFATVNTRSIKTNINIILDILNKECIDLIMVMESWLKCTPDCLSWLNSCGFNALGYKHDSVPRKGRRRGGGLLLIYKKHLTLLDSQELSIPNCEANIWKLAKNNHCFSCLGVYHPPPNQSNITLPQSIFITDFVDSLSLLIPNYPNLIVSGDFNLHVNDPTNNDAIFLLDAMASIGFTQHVRSATHFHGNILDLIFTIDSQIPVDKCTVGEFVSDHRIVLCTTNLRNPPLIIKKVKTRKINPEVVSTCISEMDLEPILNATSLHDAVKLYQSELTDKFNKHFPIVEKTIRDRPKLPWYDHWLKDQRRIMRNREKVWVKYGEDHQWLAYKRERNRYKNMLIFNKRKFLSDKVMQTRGDVKALYQLTNNLTSQTNENPLPKEKDDQEMADEFAEFFLQKILKIRELFENIPYIDVMSDPSVPVLRCFAPMTQDQVKGLILSMKTKSCELDPIPTYILKSNLEAFLPYLTKIVNLSITRGEFDQEWKSAIVRPLLKKAGSDLICKNYRLVSNLQFVLKLVEKAILSQFIVHCDNYDLLPDYQSAYRRGYSCETAVLRLINDVLWSMERQCVTPCLLLDLSAAFDTVDHDLFISIMEEIFAIKDTALQWFEQYLRPRSFRVVIGDKFSSPMNLTFSVPQGSAAGANFFVAYCQSLQKCIEDDVNLNGFADDHFIDTHFKPGDREAENLSISKLKSSFTNIEQWMGGMRLKLNSDKTEFIIFGNQIQLNKLHTDSITISGDTCIKCADVVKCLGTLIDKNVKFTDHVNTKCKVALYNFHRINSIRKYLSREACETLVLSLVISHLDYSNSVLVGCPDVLINKFQRIQNMCAKLVLSRSRSSSATDALKTLHWLPIRLRIRFKIVCLVHKCIHGTAPRYLKNLLTFKTFTRTLRSTTDNDLLLEIPKTKLKTFASRSFSVKGPEFWNQIPKELRIIKSLELFKSKLKTLYFQKF